MLSVAVGPEDMCWRLRASAYCQDHFQITRIVVVLIVQSGASTTWTNFRDIDQNAFSEIGPDIPVIDKNFANF